MSLHPDHQHVSLLNCSPFKCPRYHYHSVVRLLTQLRESQVLSPAHICMFDPTTRVYEVAEPPSLSSTSSPRTSQVFLGLLHVHAFANSSLRFFVTLSLRSYRAPGPAIHWRFQGSQIPQSTIGGPSGRPLRCSHTREGLLCPSWRGMSNLQEVVLRSGTIQAPLGTCTNRGLHFQLLPPCCIEFIRSAGGS